MSKVAEETVGTLERKNRNHWFDVSYGEAADKRNEARKKLLLRKVKKVRLDFKEKLSRLKLKE